MNDRSVTVLGAGNTGFAVAANLALAGWRVTLGELPEFTRAIEPIQAARTIQLAGVARSGAATLHAVTADVGAAVTASDTLLLIVPAYGHAAWARALAPHIRPSQTLTLFPGTLGALEVARILRAAGTPAIPVGETDTAPYVCRKTQPDGATIWGVVPHMGLGVFPATATERLRGVLDPMFPGTTPVASVLECGLSALNPVVHPAGVILNAGRIEKSRGEFYFYDEGVTPGVVDVITAVDAERQAVGHAFHYHLGDAAEAFHRAGFGPRAEPPDLWATINGSAMLTALRAPGQLNTRWLSEDVPYGLRAWSNLGKHLGVPTPVIDAVITLGLALLHLPPDTNRRTLADLGLEGMTKARMLAYVRTGEP
ncbi:MAG: NAD/NADP octopine/nopaline dehydrogenase family protein [Actinobacteria bacterium]|nr:NAD/NADP octopine/nopaline dehydrogenase family protein [Actinomycetota bacterium]